jgi:hypothetical protein
MSLSCLVLEAERNLGLKALGTGCSLDLQLYWVLHRSEFCVERELRNGSCPGQVSFQLHDRIRACHIGCDVAKELLRVSNLGATVIVQSA